MTEGHKKHNKQLLCARMNTVVPILCINKQHKQHTSLYQGYNLFFLLNIVYQFIIDMKASNSRRRQQRNRLTRSGRRQAPKIFSTWSKAEFAFLVIGSSLVLITVFAPVILIDKIVALEVGGSPKVVSLESMASHKRWNLKENGMKYFEKAKNNVIDKILSKSHLNFGHFDLEATLARGAAGLPMELTPALIGAKPGHIECDVNVDDIAYWNSPQGHRDEDFQSPFATDSSLEHYLTFEHDCGGWNNIRMSTEIIFVLAAVTGRTLVLPPNQPMYLMGHGAAGAKSFGNFYSLRSPEMQKRVKIITMSEFLEREGKRLLGFSDQELNMLRPSAKMCLHQPDSELFCEPLYQKLRNSGYQPNMGGMKNCFIFDKDHFEGKQIPPEVQKRIDRFCTKTHEDPEKGWVLEKLKPVYYNQTLHSPRLIHWNAWDDEHRLLNHFYTFFYFTDSTIDNYYKRFVRDLLHYVDELYCAAGKIVHALNAEGTWSSLHVRRGDLQYKEVKISGQEWYDNMKEVWKEGEVLFIATDESNKTFFDPLKKHHNLRFLDDYWDVAQLTKVKSLLGMVDTIVASHGRTFTGTWFSTFSGYINRMRGYSGYSIEDSWYSYLPKKDAVREWEYPEGNYPAREWPIGWTAIDGDEWIEHERIQDGVSEMPIEMPLARGAARLPWN